MVCEIWGVLYAQVHKDWIDIFPVIEGLWQADNAAHVGPK